MQAKYIARQASLPSGLNNKNVFLHAVLPNGRNTKPGHDANSKL